MDVAVADLAVEFLISEFRPGLVMQLGDQVAVGGIRWGVRQRHAGQWVEIAETVASEFQAQVEGAEIQRVSQGTGQFDTGIADLRLGLQRERLARVLQGQQPADLALPGEVLRVVLAFDLECKGIVLRCAALVLSGFRRFVADNLAEGNRLAERVDQHIEVGLQGLVVKGHVALVEADRADIDHPARRLGVRVLGIEFERPIGAAIGQTLQLGIRLGQVDARNHHALGQQGQRRNAQFDAFERDHLRLLRPVRVAQAQILGDHVRPRHPRAPAAFFRLALPDHCEVAIDGKRPVQFFRNFGVDRGFDPVPVEKHDDQNQGCQQQREDGEGPAEDFSSARHAQSS